MPEIINHCLHFTPDNLRKVEEHYDAKFVVSTEHKGVSCSVFYTAEPHPVSKSRYMALYYQAGNLMVTNGAWIEDQEIDAVESGGEIIFSRHRHDFFCTSDKEICIDGGREYHRLVGNIHGCKRHTLIVRDGTLQIATPTEL
ncbi:MAG: hypothetical protein WCY93_11245 [Anaerolineaceae bacterium]